MKNEIIVGWWRGDVAIRRDFLSSQLGVANVVDFWLESIFEARQRRCGSQGLCCGQLIAVLRILQQERNRFEGDSRAQRCGSFGGRRLVIFRQVFLVSYWQIGCVISTGVVHFGRNCNMIRRINWKRKWQSFGEEICLLVFEFWEEGKMETNAQRIGINGGDDMEYTSRRGHKIS